MRRILLLAIGALTVGGVADAAPADWSGFYVGVHGGWAWQDRKGGLEDCESEEGTIDVLLDFAGFAESSFEEDDQISFCRIQTGSSLGEDAGLVLLEGDDSVDDDSFVLGPHLGYNAQMGQLVFGAEADLSFMDFSESTERNFEIFDDVGDPVAIVDFDGSGTIDLETGTDWLATIRGRLGWAFGSFMLYGTGGVAITSLDTSADGTFAPDFDGVRTEAAVTITGDDEKTLIGLALGFGAEAMVTQNLIVRLEYLYAGFDEEEVEVDLHLDDLTSPIDEGSIGLSRSVDPDTHLIRAALSFQFGPTPGSTD